MARRRGCVAVFISGLLGIGAAVQAQVPQNLSGHLLVRTANERSTLDRTTGEIISSVDVTLVNLGGRSIQTPLHAVINLSTTVTSVAGAQGGPGDPLYGRYYRDLSAQLPQQRLAANGSVSFHIDFRYPRGRALTYVIEPRGTVVPAAPPVLSLEPLFYEMQSGEGLAIPMTATDADSPVVTIGCEPAHPEAVFTSTSGLPAAATFTFVPSNGTQGVFVFVFTARDPGGLTDEKHVQVTVNPANRAPTVEAPDTVSVDEGALVAIPVTGSDPDGDPVALAVGPLPDNAIFVQAAGGITFAPDYAQQGVYPVTCSATDGQASSAPKTVQITVNDVQAGPDPDKLSLVVHPVESPTLVARQRITGTVNADTNLPPPAAIESALITGLAPASARQGQTVDVALTGKSTGKFTTHFAAGTSVADFGADIAVNNLTVTGPAAATANITIAADAAIGPRGVQVRTLGETAVAVPAFHVLEGRASITGVLTDPDTGLPIVGALVSVAGTTLTALTGPDGSFTLNDVPTGPQTLIVNPPDHEVLRIEVEAGFDTPLVLSNLTARALVYDPTAPDNVSLMSVLGRNLGDLVGALSLEEARSVVRDAFLLAGGDELGLLDEYGNQLNPEAPDGGDLTIQDKGVELYAQRLAQGDSVMLLEVLRDLSFGFDWSGGPPPTLAQWMGALQEIVNKAWANPTDPAYRVPILLFNRGERLNPNPPRLEPEMRLSKVQAFMMVSGFAMAVQKNRAAWMARAAPAPVEIKTLLAEALPAACDLLLGPDCYAQGGEPLGGIYTVTWQRLVEEDLLGGEPTNVVIGASATETNINTTYEDLLRRYYMGGGADSYSNLVNLLSSAFPPATPGADIVAQGFMDNPYGVERVLRDLAAETTHNLEIRQVYNELISTSNSVNLWQTMDVTKGQHLPSVGWGFEFAGWSVERPQVIIKSLAPNAPYIYKALMEPYELDYVSGGSSSEKISIPVANIYFHPSGSDRWPGENPEHEQFIYRLWLVERGQAGDRGRFTMVGIGRPTTNSFETLGPRMDSEQTNRLVFTHAFPPPGLNTYRVDCIRAEETLIDDLINVLSTNVTVTNQAYATQLQPWLAGFEDNPLAASIHQLGGGVGRRRLHGGQLLIEGRPVEVSPLSRPMSVYATDVIGGLGAVGPIDLEADYFDNLKLYVSLAGLPVGDRGSGKVYRYDAQNAELVELFSPGFMMPGQKGLAVDVSNRLFFVNSASEAAYGGRIFRYSLTGDLEYESNSRQLCGTVNYYSALLQRAHPSAVAAMTMCPEQYLDASLGRELLVADSQDNVLKTIDVQTVDTYPGNPQAVAHTVGQRWAWNSASNHFDISVVTNVTVDCLPPPCVTNIDVITNMVSRFGPRFRGLAFTPHTDLLALPPGETLTLTTGYVTNENLVTNYSPWGFVIDVETNYYRTGVTAITNLTASVYLTQGADVLEVKPGADQAQSITTGAETLFTEASGCDICYRQDDAVLFIADRAEGRILRIPLGDIPIEVPADPDEKQALIDKYTFMSGVPYPDALRITDNGFGLLLADAAGVRYLRFGYSDIALDEQGIPLVGAQVLFQHDSGATYADTTDAEGRYEFQGIPEGGGQLSINHPDFTSVEDVNLDTRCEAFHAPAIPCVIITDPPHGAVVTGATVTVRGIILPTQVLFRASGGQLSVQSGDSYELDFPDNDHRFVVTGVALTNGLNRLRVFTRRNGHFEAGASLFSDVHRANAPATTQSAVGVAMSADGRVLRGATVRILVDGVEAAVVAADGCGYYRAENLPLGAITVEVLP